MTLSQSLLRALLEHGAKEIFGIPGDFALPFFRQIEQSKLLPLYTLSHEPAVGFAADASARVRSSLGVAAVTYGAGAFNMVNAIAGAYAEKSPVVVISGAPGLGESKTGLLLHHQAKTLDSELAVFREITCDQTRLDDVRTAPAEIARVLERCRRESRPVYIELPRDMVAVECEPVIPLETPSVSPEALGECADEVMGALSHAESRVLMVGVEVRRFGLEAKVAELARRLGVPVVTSMLARGLLADGESPLIGTYLGLAGHPEVTEAVETSDMVLMLGVILSEAQATMRD